MEDGQVSRFLNCECQLEHVVSLRLMPFSYSLAVYGLSLKVLAELNRT